MGDAGISGSHGGSVGSVALLGYEDSGAPHNRRCPWFFTYEWAHLLFLYTLTDTSAENVTLWGGFTELAELNYLCIYTQHYFATDAMNTIYFKK